MTYHHQILAAAIVHPTQKQVISLCPEPILKQDGSQKNDCERNVCYRLLDDLQKEHPCLRLTMILDAPSANFPIINRLKAQNLSFIINVKPKGNQSSFHWVQGITTELKITKGANEYCFKYVNKVPLNDT